MANHLTENVFVYEVNENVEKEAIIVCGNDDDSMCLDRHVK